MVPYQDNAVGAKHYDHSAYRERPIIATRYEKLAANYLAMVTIACIFEWF